MLKWRNNKMDEIKQLDIIHFLHQFFKAKHCPILFLDNHRIHVQLSIEIDKALMNRPFYWQYIEATNQQGTPQQLAFTTNVNDANATDYEWIHYGSPWLQKIYNYILKNNQLIHLFEVHQTNIKTVLHPWLLTNYLITYDGKQRKEKLFSIGLNLINGTIATNMMNRLQSVHLAPNISAYCYITSPIITLQSGFLRVEQFIKKQIANENLDWAADSIKLMNKELNMTTYFYEENQQQLELETMAIKERLEPIIKHKVVQGGIVYISPSFLQKEKTSS